jgi:type IV pilus assembly protein PilX
MQAQHAQVQPPPFQQAGATLVVGLVLLLVLTVLGVSSMNTATMEVTMAGNMQFQQDSFQLAEDAIDLAITQRNFSTAGPTFVPLANTPDKDRQAITTFQVTTPVPDLAFSTGTSTGSIQAFHFDTLGVGHASRNATSTHTQSFYIVGPGGP